MSENNKRWFRENAAKRHAYHLLRKYGLTLDAGEFTFGSQGRRCAICGTEEPGGRFNKWQIDHDHVTGKFRGVVCYRCNQLLGYALDNIEILLNAAKYLRGEKNVISE